jgi:sec-independent protein translocase protein TatC
MHEESKPLWDHVSDLRSAIICALSSAALGIVLCLCFHQEILAILTSTLSQEGSAPPQLILLSPLEGFTSTLKVCFWGGFLLSSPAWLYFLIRFIKPGLRVAERSLLVPFILSSLVFMTIGFLTAYWVTIPLANLYLETFNREIGLNLWTLSHYIDYTFFLMLANGVAFELGVVMFFLVHLGIFTPAYMIYMRRPMIVAAFILGALLTPPDVLTQLLMAGLLILLYEAVLLYSKFMERYRG